MTCRPRETGKTPAPRDKLENGIRALIADHFDGEDGTVARIDRWTRQHVLNRAIAKLGHVVGARDPRESLMACLIAEVDREAASGVFLANPAGQAAQYARLVGHPGLSGRLFQYLQVIGPTLFRDELTADPGRPELFWSAVQTRYEQASLDTEVSELILMHLLEDDEAAVDTIDSLRADFYAWHEDRVRRRCRLPRLLDGPATRWLYTTVSEQRERARRTGCSFRAGDGPSVPRKAS